MLGLYQAANVHGIEATGYEASINDIIDFDNVLILHVTTEEGAEHYIVNFGFEQR